MIIIKQQNYLFSTSQQGKLNHLKNAAEAYKYVANKYDRTIIDSAPNGKLKSIEEISDELRDIVIKNIKYHIKCKMNNLTKQ